MRILRLASASLVVVLGVVAPGGARASVCPSWSADSGIVEGAVDVPLNVRFYALADLQPPAQVTLDDCAGHLVAMTTTQIAVPSRRAWDTGPLYVSTPTTPLTPSTAYCKGGKPWFTTGATTLSGTPPVPVLGEPTFETWEFDEAYDGPSFKVAFAGLSRPESGLLLVNLNGAATFDATTFTGAVQAVDQNRKIHQTTFELKSYSACGSNWPNAALGSTMTVSIGYLDIAGHFSGWSNTVTVAVPAAWTHPKTDRSTDEGAGCSWSPSARPSMSAGVALMVCGLLLRRRRGGQRPGWTR